MYSNSSNMAIGFIPGDLGVRGVRGWGEIILSSKTWGPKSWTRVEESGGGMGYMPKLISNKERPSDHKSLATEYCDPYKKKKDFLGNGTNLLGSRNLILLLNAHFFKQL